MHLQHYIHGVEVCFDAWYYGLYDSMFYNLAYIQYLGSFAD